MVSVAAPAAGAAVQLDIAAAGAAVGVEQDCAAEVGSGGAVPASGEVDAQGRAAAFEAQPGGGPAALGPAALEGELACGVRRLSGLLGHDHLRRVVLVGGAAGVVGELDVFGDAG